MRGAAPSEPVGTRASPTRVLAVGPEGGLSVGNAVPKVVVKADLLPALSALSLVALLGFPLAWLWSRLALPREGVLAETGAPEPLMLVESYHQFDALAIFMLLGFAAGVLIAAGLWMVRGRRGPVVLIAGVLGSLVAGWLGFRLGPAFAAGRYPMPAEGAVGELVTMPPELGVAWVVLAAPLAVALTYGLLATWNGMDDLGRRLR